MNPENCSQAIYQKGEHRSQAVFTTAVLLKQQTQAEDFKASIRLEVANTSWLKKSMKVLTETLDLIRCGSRLLLIVMTDILQKSTIAKFLLLGNLALPQEWYASRGILSPFGTLMFCSPDQAQAEDFTLLRGAPNATGQTVRLHAWDATHLLCHCWWHYWTPIAAVRVWASIPPSMLRWQWSTVSDSKPPSGGFFVGEIRAVVQFISQGRSTINRNTNNFIADANPKDDPLTIYVRFALMFLVSWQTLVYSW